MQSGAVGLTHGHQTIGGAGRGACGDAAAGVNNSVRGAPQQGRPHHPGSQPGTVSLQLLSNLVMLPTQAM